MNKRDEQRQATRRQIVRTATEVLIERGAAATTTVAVQRAAGLSRGALLHHFPTRDALLAAAIELLVEKNEKIARKALASAPPEQDPITRAVRTLGLVATQPAFAAELDLWAAARTDPGLRGALQRQEKGARGDLYRVVDAAFGSEVTAASSYPRIAALTVHFLRGLAVSQILREGAHSTEQLLEDWTAVVRSTL